MYRIKDVHALEVLDSRGNPTIEVTITLNNNIKGSAIVPSGASKGFKEAYELRDNDKNRYLGKGVLKAVNNVNTIIKNKLIGMDVTNQLLIDKTLILLDDSKNKENLGANAILGVSLAVAKAAANYYNMPLFKYIGGINANVLPTPLMNVINGGAHSYSTIDFQEYFIIPANFKSFKEALRAGSEIFHHLKDVLKENGYETNVGDEGGYAPLCKNGNTEPLELIIKAIKKASYIPGKDIFLGLDVAANEFYNEKTKTYDLKKSNEGSKTSNEMIDYYIDLVNKYPIITIEDALNENDIEGWKELTLKLKDKIQLVGDDLFVTNKEILREGIKNNIANSILIKYNQIGTLSETLQAINLAKSNNYSTIISHRSGESEDNFIASLAVATNASQIKTGSLSRSDRTSKYNELLRIEDTLQDEAMFLGLKAFKKYQFE